MIELSRDVMSGACGCLEAKRKREAQTVGQLAALEALHAALRQSLQTGEAVILNPAPKRPDPDRPREVLGRPFAPKRSLSAH